ncbi:hypothetical protein [Thermococcus sp.]
MIAGRHLKIFALEIHICAPFGILKFKNAFNPLISAVSPEVR